jgi:plastocyanin
MFKLYKKTFCIFLLLLPIYTHAAEFSIIVKSPSGQAVKDAVITLTAKNTKQLKKSVTYVVDQINKTYVPHVKIIPAGSNISFPNKDDIRHHVYSFSEAKKFELPLYEGTPTKPIAFNKAGVVVLGCNIHDWMRAYIFISDTPYHGLTKQSGQVTIKNIPKGIYTLQIWHPRITRKSQNKPIKINLTKNKITSYKTTISLKPAFKIRRAPKAKRRRY